MFWDKEKECIDREELKQLQLERLQSTIHRAYRYVPFYRKKFDDLGIDPDDISSLEDLKKLPFTTKEDLRQNYPYGLLAVPLREVVRLHASSGTTGLPTVVGYTRNDLKIWTELVARNLVAGGVTKDDVIQIAYNYGLFTGAFGLHYGAEKIGASVVPISSENPKKQIKIMQDYKTTVLACTPSYALAIAETLIDMVINPSSMSLKLGILGAEPWSEGMRREIEEKLRIKTIDTYGLSEIYGPGVAGECIYQNGLHVNDDHLFIEIVDPETLENVPDGQEGELVITTLTREAMPIIRYRTRDLTRIIPGECECGRTFLRIDRIKGRTDDLIIIKGVKVFPSQIEEILCEIQGIEPHYQIVMEKKGFVDEITVLVEASEELFFDEMRKQNELIRQIEERIKEELDIDVKVKLVEKKTLERFKGKAKRVINKEKE
ncbi:phenylacetate--CoA ligase family protein [Thermodesulfovibrio hydrogeniphilus]